MGGMKPGKRLKRRVRRWLTRDGKKPGPDYNLSSVPPRWNGAYWWPPGRRGCWLTFCSRDWHRMYSIRLKPGEGPVEVTMPDIQRVKH